MVLLVEVYLLGGGGGLPMARFVLTPGEGGPRGSIAAVPGVASYGGAGGGIVVNGEKTSYGFQVGVGCLLIGV